MLLAAPQAARTKKTRASFSISPPLSIPFHTTGNTTAYASVLDCFAKTFREGGVRAFYKGFTSNFARLGAWNSAMFVLLEQTRAALR